MTVRLNPKIAGLVDDAGLSDHILASSSNRVTNRQAKAELIHQK